MTNALNKILPAREHETLIVDPATESKHHRKIDTIRYHFQKIMEAMNLDMADDSLKDTPLRLAEMYVKEIFSGLDPDSFPKISVFENTYGYKEMLVERNIEVYSFCEHHFLPFIGKAQVAYFPSDKVIGLSKLNRIVKHFSRRPQVQERLTMDIANCLKEILQTEDVAVMIEAKHLCVAARGVEDEHSTTVTNHLAGKFLVAGTREMFLKSAGARD